MLVLALAMFVCGAQQPVRAVGLGHEQEARRLLVEPVHDPLALVAADLRKRTAASLERVHERSAPVARGRIHDHAV